MTPWTLETTGTLESITRQTDLGVESTIEGLADELRRWSGMAEVMYPTPTSAPVTGGVTEPVWCAIATTRYLSEAFGRRYYDSAKSWTDCPIQSAPSSDPEVVF